MQINHLWATNQRFFAKKHSTNFEDFDLIMSNLKIKTECGIQKYNELKKNQSYFGKLRLLWFKFFAVIRDFNK